MTTDPLVAYRHPAPDWAFALLRANGVDPANVIEWNAEEWIDELSGGPIRSISATEIDRASDGIHRRQVSFTERVTSDS